MSLLTKPENSTTATTPLRKPDSLRVRQSDSDAARVVPLSDGKATIGSSPQCTIVLPASECRPLQCVITLDAHRAEATRWGAGVQLNRRDFTKSVVGVGDKLSIGCCELEFAVADPPAATSNAPQALAPVAVAPPTPLPPAVEPPKAEAVEAKPPEPVIAAPAPQPAPAAEAPKPTVVKLLPAPTPPAVALPAMDPVETKTPAVEPLAPQLVAVESFVEAPAAVQPSALPKAITVPVVSSPTLIAPVAPAAATVTEETKPEAEAAGKLNCTTSQQFADELILQLWQTSDAARRRARTLIAAARDARFRADAMYDDLSAMEVELDLARAAYDSHAANHEKLHLEIIERDRQAAERLAPLVNEVESLRSQLQESQIELAEQAARCDELSAALDVQAADKAAADAQLAEAHRASELEQSLNVQIEQATLLARELGAVRTELDAVRTQLDRQLARQQEVEADLAGTRQQCESLQHTASELAESEVTVGHLRDEVAALQAERSDLHGKLADSEGELHRLAEMYLAHTSQPEAAEQGETHGNEEPRTEVAEAPAVAEALPVADVAEATEAADHFALVEPVHADEPTSQEADASESFSDAHAFAAVEPVKDHAEAVAEPEEHLGWPLPAALEAEPAADAHAEIEPTPTDFAPLSPFPLVAEPTPTPAPVEHESHESAAFAPPQELKTVPVESETATSSFIDKYRHLLDDEPGEPIGATLQSPLGAARPMLDDEFLSPAKAAERTAHADDSDEALEAYMANMMARMRGVSASSMVEPAPLQAAVELPVAEETPSYDPSVPFEIESMKQGRRAPISTDLAALREIANSSARSAIATHRNKRKMESAAGKVVIAIAAFGASGFLMSSAPTLMNWQFLAGIAVAIIGFGAAALAVRGRADGDHFVDALPASFTEDEREHGA